MLELYEIYEEIHEVFWIKEESVGVSSVCLFLWFNGIEQLAELLNKPAVCLRRRNSI